MRIPCLEDANGTARAEETGPVFHVDPEDGQLHMRYTARTTSIDVLPAVDPGTVISLPALKN